MRLVQRSTVVRGAGCALILGVLTLRIHAQDAPLIVRVVDSVGLPADVHDTIEQQVEQIWAAANVSLDVQTRAGAASPRDARIVHVLLREDIPAPRGRSGDSLESRIGLAWTPFDGDRAGSLIFVSVNHTRRLLATFSYGGQAVSTCPAALGRLLLGRALGRVIAHEIGHYLYGPAHEPSGVMRAMLSEADLLTEDPPRVLPRLTNP